MVTWAVNLAKISENIGIYTYLAYEINSLCRSENCVSIYFNQLQRNLK
jgi:hypothetical protein